VKMGIVALDGSKIAANAALEANRTYAHIQGEAERRLRVEKMLNDAQTQDEAEDRRYGADKRGCEPCGGDEMPDDFADPRSRRARLAVCKKQLEERAALEATQQRAEINARAVEEAETGTNKRGRKPQEPNPAPVMEAKANVTDPDSRIMKTRSGYVQGYNGQAVVTEEQIILAAEITQQANDVNQLHPMVEKARENMAVMAPEASPTIEVVLADAGYISEKNLAGIDPDALEHLIATKNAWKQRGENEGAPRGRMPDTLTLRRSDGTQAAHGAGGTTPARPCVVQEAGAEGGACVGSDQGGSWDSAFYAQRAFGLCPGMGIDLRNAQSSEVVAKWKGDFTFGGLVKISGWG